MVSVMAIEIKELIIKTNMVQSPNDEHDLRVLDKQALKDELLAACRQLVQAMLRERRER